MQKLKHSMLFNSTLRQNKTQDEESFYLRRRRVVSIASLVILIAFFIVVWITIGKPLLDLASQPEAFRAWINQKGALGRFYLIGMMILQVVVAVIPGEMIEIGAGYAFGAWEGTLLVLVGAAIGSAVIFLLTKKFGVSMVEAFISREKMNQLKFINTEKKRNLFIFISFFIPGTPKDLLTYFIGLTPMKLHTFLLISTFARIPSVITSTIGGHALGIQDYTFAVIVFAITVVISGGGLLFYRLLLQRKQKQARDTHPPLNKK